MENQRYYNLTLSNGEVVIGHLAGDAHIQGIGTTQGGDALYLLPVGRWETLDLPAGYSGVLSGEGYADNTHFVECVGETYLTIGRSLPFSSPVIKSSASCGSWCLSALTLFAPPF